MVKVLVKATIAFPKFLELKNCKISLIISEGLLRDPQFLTHVVEDHLSLHTMEKMVRESIQ